MGRRGPRQARGGGAWLCSGAVAGSCMVMAWCTAGWWLVVRAYTVSVAGCHVSVWPGQLAKCVSLAVHGRTPYAAGALWQQCAATWWCAAVWPFATDYRPAVQDANALVAAPAPFPTTPRRHRRACVRPDRPRPLRQNRSVPRAHRPSPSRPPALDHPSDGRALLFGR